MSAPDLLHAVEGSVVGLHEVFADWLGDGRAGLAFDPVEEVLGPAFVLVSPDGRSFERDPLLASLRAARGSRPGLVIQARGTTLVAAAGSLVVASYDEWQTIVAGGGPPRTDDRPPVEPSPEDRQGSRWTCRRSLAVLEVDERVRWGLRWLRVQETWSPAPPEPRR